MLKVNLGNTKIQVSRVGFGVLPLGPGQLALPLDEGASLICYGIKNGINFFDTAQYYRTYPYIRRAMEMLSHKQGSDSLLKNLVISSKSLAADYDGMTDAINECLAELNRDVLDIFLLHEVRTGQFNQRSGAWQALIDARSRGLVRAIGLSTHHVDVTRMAAGIPECDVVFSLINYTGMGIRLGSESGTKEDMLEAIRLCERAGKGVFTMKVFGGGNLTSHYQEALDYVFSKKEIQSVMIGFGHTSEIDDITNYMHGTMPLNYNPDFSHKKVRINQEDCEGCGSCLKACASNAVFYNKNGLAQINQSKCITCGYCAYACPVRAVIMY